MTFAASDIVKDAIEKVQAILWEDITYNGQAVQARVFRTPQVQTQDGIKSYEYEIEVMSQDISEPVRNCDVIIDGNQCFSGQEQDLTSEITWRVTCPVKGSL